jgi:hypothetical protein
MKDEWLIERIIYLVNSNYGFTVKYESYYKKVAWKRLILLHYNLHVSGSR